MITRFEVNPRLNFSARQMMPPQEFPSQASKADNERPPSRADTFARIERLEALGEIETA